MNNADGSADRSRPDGAFSVLAIVATYNEVDVIEPVIRHLAANGIGVYLIDNGSTDDTVDAASTWLGKGLVGAERFESAPEDVFDFEGILRRKEEIAREQGATWYIHHDADEIREGPWPGLDLKSAIEYVDALGFNCIDFRPLNFRPVDDDFRRGIDPAEHFLFYEEAQDFDQLQLKCWKAAPDVDLVGSAGHQVRFDGRRVFPIQFLLRHYPIRSTEHGRRKVFEERIPRFREDERAKGWHIQYDGLSNGEARFLFDPAELKRFDREAVRLELMVENRSWRDLRRAVEDAAVQLRESLDGLDSIAPSQSRDQATQQLSEQLGDTSAE